jgi:hypothetical protein
VSLGSLFPPGDLPGTDAGAGALKKRIVIELDGRRILDQERETFPTLPQWVTFGANNIGGSAAGPTFFGEIRKVTAAPPGDFGL